jgi:hypothetical protein
MVNNTIRAQMSFSFKGETHELDAIIDLDRCRGEAAEPPNFHQLLARACGIDPYSYLYEVMESHEITFSDPTGVATQTCCDGGFDWSRFEQIRRQKQDWEVVRAIAERTLNVLELDERSDLKAALLAAYEAGKANGTK